MAKLIDKILRPLGLARRSSLRRAASKSTSSTGGGLTYAEIVDRLYSTDPAYTIPTVYRCVKLISESVASLPMRYMTLSDSDGVYHEATGSPMWRVLRVQPNRDFTAFDFWGAVVVETLLEGNAYILPIYNPEEMAIESLVLCTRHTVSYNKATRTYTITDAENGINGVFAESEVIHIKGLGYDHKQGESVLGYLRNTLTLARLTESESIKRIANGGKLSGVLTNSKTGVGGFGDYADEELSNVADNLEELVNQDRRIVPIPGEADLKLWQMSSADLQLLQQREFTVREICRAFGVHPSFVFSDTSSNYKSAEMANAAFLSNTLNPILVKIESELLRKLIPSAYWAYRRFEFDRRSLYACDLESKADYYSKMVQAGAYTINDVRAMENLPGFDEGDQPLISANLRPLGATE